MANFTNVSLSLTLAYIIFHVSAYTFLKPSNSDIGCRDENGALRRINDSWDYQTNCENIQCVHPESKYYFLIKGCDLVAVPRGCREIRNRDASFPACCPQIKC